MYYDIDARVIKEAEFIVKEKATVRKASEKFGVSKSTVHFDVTKRLKDLDADLYKKVKKLLFINLSERHIRGGIATRAKFKKQAELNPKTEKKQKSEKKEKSTGEKKTERC